MPASYGITDPSESARPCRAEYTSPSQPDESASPVPATVTDLGSLFGWHWVEVKDGDTRARALFERHYTSRQYTDGRRRTLFVGPGEKMVLLSTGCDALFVWRKFRSMDGQVGVNCAVFRNESAVRSSVLIREACELAWRRWPGQRLYTYVNDRKVRSGNPGRCFKAAGWMACGRTKSKRLTILELCNPCDAAAREAARGRGLPEGSPRVARPSPPPYRLLVRRNQPRRTRRGGCPEHLPRPFRQDQHEGATRSSQRGERRVETQDPREKAFNTLNHSIISSRTRFVTPKVGGAIFGLTPRDPEQTLYSSES